MRMILDTHTLLWFALNDPRLSGTAMALILDTAHEKLVSPASHRETAIKISVGKYALARPFEAFFRAAIDDDGFRHLPIEPRHTAAPATLPYHHRDPSDRLLVAQAMVEQAPILSADAALDAYPVRRIW
ncbi:PIN domain protein [Aquisphaera giovannonii]|uniref:PIN domain protein n=1 Tax=Aquisphaera giovannonii TaxID=406548 RepID=A0A5B9W572_9BACT|nr:type II toxin-antitoxin system VapC family toxin [Aquisphaera giovannonii]QEH35708.1 PIN domain protein [Aquisphaera giovannonii]